MPPPISAATTLVIGDSQANGLERSGELDGVRIEDAVGRSISYFRTWLREHASELSGVSQIYLQMGGNDISAGRSASRITADLEAIVADVQRLAPGARIVVGTIPVRGVYLDRLAETDPTGARRRRAALTAVNEWIARAPGIVAFDTNRIIADPAHPDRPTRAYAGDGIHLSRSGYVALADAFEDRFIPAEAPTPTPTPVPPAPAAGGACLIGRGRASYDRRVALTFDDGPNPTHTPAVLDILRANGVHATFFVTGDNARLYPDLIRRIVAEGHELGSHSAHHDNLAHLDAAEINVDLDSVQTAVDAALGYHYDLDQVRPPYGSDRGVVRPTLEARGECDVNWDVDSLDWRYRRDTNAIFNEIFTGPHRLTRRGGTILFHDIHPYAPRVLQRVIDRLRHDGYTFSTTGTFVHEARGGGDS